ncbi:hypothetical protein CUZ95_2742 [Enterococcus lactis]|nr:hypothetical protein [Enterococcus lactis]
MVNGIQPNQKQEKLFLFGFFYYLIQRIFYSLFTSNFLILH